MVRQKTALPDRRHIEDRARCLLEKLGHNKDDLKPSADKSRLYEGNRFLIRRINFKNFEIFIISYDGEQVYRRQKDQIVHYVKGGWERQLRGLYSKNFTDTDRFNTDNREKNINPSRPLSK